MPYVIKNTLQRGNLTLARATRVQTEGCVGGGVRTKA